MSIVPSENLLIEDELKIVVIGEPSTGKVRNIQSLYSIIKSRNIFNE
jgi:hypothetical protein